jgi:putative transposase
MNFRRYYIPGSAVFITQVVERREPIFQNEAYLDLLREILRNVKQLYPFNMIAYVFLYDHFHLLLQGIGNTNFSQIMQSLKPNFTKEYKKLLGISATESMKFWQKRFWDHVIRDDKDFENHLHYIHYNPVKHSYVTDPRNWKYSSYIEWEKLGLYPPVFRYDEPQNVNWGE